MEKGSHYNLCISDLIMGLLFIFILVLLSFMLAFQSKKSEYQDETKKVQSELQDKKEEIQNKLQGEKEKLQSEFQSKIEKLKGELQSKTKELHALRDEVKGFSRPLIERGRIIKNINDDLKKEGIASKIDEKNGVLKLVSLEHYFDKGQYKLNRKGKEYFKKIRETLFANIVCYSDWSKIAQKRWPSSSKDQNRLKSEKERCQTPEEDHKHGLIDSILIEGHADPTPISAFGNLWLMRGIRTNLDLAVKRSIEVFQTLLEYKETYSNKKASSGNHLFALTNKQGQPLFGVTSFGNLRSHYNKKSRSLAQVKEDQRQDRRVDIRFVMGQPEELKDIAGLSKKTSK